MRIAIDAVGIRSRGGANVAVRIVDELQDNVRPFDDIRLYVSPRSMREFDFVLRQGLMLERPLADRSLAARTAWHYSTFSRACRGADVAITLTGTSAVRSVPLVSFIQQSLPFSRHALLTLPHSMQLRFAVIRKLMERSAERATAIVVQTHAMKTAVRSAFPTAGDIRVIEEPMPSYYPRASGAPRRILYVGNAAPYKQLPVLIDGLSGIVSGRRLSATLVGVGDYVVTAPGFRSVASLHPDDMPSLYENFDIFVMASLAETAALPLLEAISALVVPVVPDLPYAREICGDAARYFSPTDPGSLEEAVGTLVSNPTSWQEAEEAVADRAANLRASRARSTGNWGHLLVSLAH